MIPLLAAIGLGVVALLPRLRAARAASTPEQAWDHFLVASGMRPVPLSMADVQKVAALADVPPSLLDRAALGRVDGALALVAPLANGRVLVAVRRTGPAPTAPGTKVREGWFMQVRPGPVERAWADTPVRAAGAGSGRRPALTPHRPGGR